MWVTQRGHCSSLRFSPFLSCPYLWFSLGEIASGLGSTLRGPLKKASPHLSWRRVATVFACPPCSVSEGSYCHGNQPEIPARFQAVSFSVIWGHFWPQLPGFGQFRGSGLPLYPAASLVSRTAFMTSALLPMVASLGLLEGPHRLLSQLMVFVITVIGCPCSHSLSPCPKGRNSGASCRPHTCRGFARI